MFDAQQQVELDAHAQSGATVFQINIKGTQYEINLTSWKQINTTNRTRTRKIKQDFANGAARNTSCTQPAVPSITQTQPSPAHTEITQQVCNPHVRDNFH